MGFEAGIDCVVINYRTPGDLQEFVESFIAYKPEVAVTLWIVNVVPTAEDRRLADEYAEHLAEVPYQMEFKDNVGYGKAANYAVRLGSHETVAVFNADVVLTENALQHCHDALWSEPEWGILGPRQIDQDRRITAGGIFGGLEHPGHRGWKEPDRGQFQDVRDDAVFANGSAMFVKRDVWRELDKCEIYRRLFPLAAGPLLESKHWYEDTLLGYHAHAHGWKSVFYGPVTMIHKWHQASEHGGWADQLMPESQRLFRMFCGAHGIPCD